MRELEATRERITVGSTSEIGGRVGRGLEIGEAFGSAGSYGIEVIFSLHGIRIEGRSQMS